MTQASIFDVAPNTVEAPVYKTPKKTRTGRKSEDADFFAAYFKARPNTWISALELMNQRACLSFRTRISDLRFAPYGMDVRNKQATVAGKRHSFYRYFAD